VSVAGKIIVRQYGKVTQPLLGEVIHGGGAKEFDLMQSAI
jgi:hypothetical protein